MVIVALNDYKNIFFDPIDLKDKEIKYFKEDFCVSQAAAVAALRAFSSTYMVTSQVFATCS